VSEAGFRVGTSGWNYKHWKGIFYPQDLRPEAWFGYYHEHFDTVEINYTFYQLPEERTFQGWQGQASQGFLYAVKANQYITHMKKLREPSESLQNFLPRVRMLEENLGPILWQLPPRWRANPERLEGFVQLLPEDLESVFEFRDPDWFQEEIREILERYGMIFCIHDKENVGCPRWVTTDAVYLRFHGCEGDYGREYGKERLRSWAERIKAWLAEERAVYAYFNNDVSGYALKDAQRLKELLQT
jgi:uncharacterized protein YecE (DUF72 family)